MTSDAGSHFARDFERAAYERQYRGVLDDLTHQAPAVLLERFILLEATLDTGMVEVKSALLASGLFSNEDDHALGTWIHRQHWNLARLGLCVTELACATPEIETSRAMRALALTLLHWGEALKWELMVGRAQHRDLALVHGLMQIALDKGRRGESGILTVDGLHRLATIEALYFRTLLLERFTSGNLTRQQIEVLDAWLWEWAPYLSSDAQAAGPVLRADLDSDSGLRLGRREGQGKCLYLPLEPLEEQRRAMIEQFHLGRVVPTTGRVAQMRIEAHVAVLLGLRRLFSGEASRAPRHRVRPTQVEIWVGLPDIIRLVETDERFAGAPPACASDPKNAFDSIYDKPALHVTLRNLSNTGFLVEMPAAAADGLHINELMALRLRADDGPVIARIVRRVREVSGDVVSLGLQRMCDPTARPRIAKLVTPAGDEQSFIFAPGADPSGRHDGFLVPYRMLQGNDVHAITVGGRTYRLAFNRVRRRGRGWAMAGFEMRG